MLLIRNIVSLALYLCICGCSGPVKLKNTPPQNGRICCFGDSLVFGTGAETSEQSYPAQLAEVTAREVTKWGTPGDTTADALAKLDRFNGEDFGIVIVTIGGNDILKRVQWPETEKNLRELLARIQRTGAVVVFTGITGPLNPTRDKLYGKICREMGILYISEILDGIKGDTGLMADAVHPNGSGYRLMAERVADALREAALL